MAHSQAVVIFDVDNTLYNFVDFFAPSFRSMMHALADTSEIRETVIIESARDVYRAAGTLEHQTLIENMSVFKHLSNQERENLKRVARQAFSRTSRRYLLPYSGMVQTVSLLKEAGCVCLFVTNAPIYHVHKRLVDLGLFRFADGLLAWKGSKIDKENSEHHRKYVDRLDSIRRSTNVLIELEDYQIKPFPYAFEIVMKLYSTKFPFFSIGDSISKDLEPAKKVGMATIFAKYGVGVEEKNLDTVLQVTPWSSKDIRMHAQTSHSPDFIAETPEDILKFVNVPLTPRQGSLF